MKYAVIDIETTGGHIRRDRITEIAIILYEDGRVTDEFQSLINPERSIPYNITQLTGISDDMVTDAPKFYEVAKQIVEITQGAVFVAHNVGFDYKFIKEEFSRLGYSYVRKQLCTVRLSRSAFPGHRSYSLDNMIKRFKIPMTDRHRAMADAKAALFILEKVFDKQNNQKEAANLINRGVQASKLPPNITLEQLHNFPEACGVYYFHNKKGNAIYIGKSINIKKRLLDHFANNTAKGMRMIQQVTDISYELTGSELVALLLESDEIKKNKPVHNRKQRRTKYPIGIYSFRNNDGYVCFGLAKDDKKFDLLARYEKTSIANAVLQKMVREHNLCRPFCGLEGLMLGNCLNYQLGLCNGACSGHEQPRTYNRRANKVIEKLKLDFDINFLIIEEGRNREEEAVILVENGAYQGFGYVDKDEARNIEDYKSAIKSYKNNPDTSRIIKQYLRKNVGHKIVKF